MRQRAMCFVLAMAAFACSGGTDPDPGQEPQAVLTSFESASPTAVVGTAVAIRPAVRVTKGGAPAAGVSVTFAVASGGGSVAGATQATDANGEARVGGWTLGTTAGVNSLTATVSNASGSPVTFQSTGVAGPASQLVKTTGDGQTAPAGSQLPSAPTVEVRDQFGNKVSGQQVSFAITGGGGSITGTTQQSDANGIARVGSWTLGASAGPNTLSATAGAATATFTATATAGAATQVIKNGGDQQTAAAGTAVVTRPSVRIADQFGNPVAGVQVTFASTGGVVAGATQTTGADGIATVGTWTLSQTAGPNSLTATATGAGLTGNPAIFTATGVAGAPVQMAKLGDNQTANTGAQVAINPAVDLSDAFNNKIVGFPVVFSVTGGGGTITGQNAITDANGRATLGSWILGPSAGANTLTATAGSVTVTFNATALATFNAAQYVGTYAGTWVNNTFGSVGTGNVVISINPATSTATAVITVTGNVLGSGGVAPSNQNTTYNANGATFNGVHSVMGTVTATVNAQGQINASGTNIPNAGISRWDATGSITPSQLILNFTVTFTAGAPATGTITLNKTG